MNPSESRGCSRTRVAPGTFTNGFRFHTAGFGNGLYMKNIGSGQLRTSDHPADKEKHGIAYYIWKGFWGVIKSLQAISKATGHVELMWNLVLR